MPVVKRVADSSADIKVWHRHLPTVSAFGLECQKTAAFVAGRLREFGVDETHEGIAGTGIVAIINGQGDGPMGHNSEYNFDDDIGPIGATLFACPEARIRPALGA